MAKFASDTNNISTPSILDWCRGFIKGCSGKGMLFNSANANAVINALDTRICDLEALGAPVTYSFSDAVPNADETACIITVTGSDASTQTITVPKPVIPEEMGLYLNGSVAPAIDLAAGTITYQTVNDADETAGAPLVQDISGLIAALTSPNYTFTGSVTATVDPVTGDVTVTGTDNDTFGTLTGPDGDGNYTWTPAGGGAPIVVAGDTTATITDGGSNLVNQTGPDAYTIRPIKACNESSDSARNADVQVDVFLHRGNVGTIDPQYPSDCPVGKAADGQLYVRGKPVSDGELVAGDLSNPDRPDLSKADIVAWRDATYPGQAVDGLYVGPNNQKWAFNIDKNGNVIVKCIEPQSGGSIFTRWEKTHKYYSGGEGVEIWFGGVMPGNSTVTFNYPITLSTNVVRIVDGNGAGDVTNSPSLSGPVMRPAAGRTTTSFDAVNTGATTIAVDHYIRGVC